MCICLHANKIFKQQKQNTLETRHLKWEFLMDGIQAGKKKRKKTIIQMIYSLIQRKRIRLQKKMERFKCKKKRNVVRIKFYK